MSHTKEPATSEPQEWECPDCRTRYVSNVGKCGDLHGCSRPYVVPVSTASDSVEKWKWPYGYFIEDGSYTYRVPEWARKSHNAALQAVWDAAYKKGREDGNHEGFNRANRMRVEPDGDKTT